MSAKESIVITGAKRTAMGSMLGVFNQTPAAALGAAAIQAAVTQSQIDPARVDEVFMGCVLQAGQGQAPARQAALGANLPQSTACTTVNKMCGSGMQAVMLGHDILLAGSADSVIAGGMENMSLAPYLLPKARQGFRFGHQQTLDHMCLDGLEDAYERGKLMGCYAEDTAKKYELTREMQDEFALSSLARAQQAIESGAFKTEITPLDIKQGKKDVTVDQDEQPGKARPDKIPQLRPAFQKDGTVTAANASSISDGAAALVLARESEATAPLARIVAHARHAQAPAWFTTAPVGAVQKVLTKANWSVDDVDLFEINEAFAVVTLAAIHDLELNPAKVNIHGGACALGHPIGASGARILVTLIHALQQQNKRRGVAALCIGGGEATAMAIELL